MKTFSVTKIPDELWTLLLETLPRSLNINDGIHHAFERRVLNHFDDEDEIRNILRGTLDENDPTMDELVSYYRSITEKYED
jgi:plasmid stability protein